MLSETPCECRLCQSVLVEYLLYAGNWDEKLQRAQTELSRSSQNSTNWVIFRNGKYLEEEIARRGTHTSYPESLDWYTVDSNKNLFPYPLEKS